MFECFVFPLTLNRLKTKSGRSSPDQNGSANTKMVMRCNFYSFFMNIFLNK